MDVTNRVPEVLRNCPESPVLLQRRREEEQKNKAATVKCVKVESKFLDAKELAALLGVTRKEVYALHRRGLVPRPVKFPTTGRGLRPRQRWSRSEINDWFAADMPTRFKWEAEKKLMRK